MIKNRLTPVAIAAVAGVAVGIFWLFEGPSPNCVYWQSSECEPWVVNWLAYASCPLLYNEFNRLSIVIVPFLNGVMYGLLVYLALRTHLIISAGIILGYAAAVFWEIAHFTGMSISYWLLNWKCWLIYASFPLVGFMGTGKLNEGFQPLLNAMHVVMLIFVIRWCAKRPATLTRFIHEAHRKRHCNAVLAPWKQDCGGDFRENGDQGPLKWVRMDPRAKSGYLSGNNAHTTPIMPVLVSRFQG